jgi:DNA-binding MarR family transcriptional regulator
MNADDESPSLIDPLEDFLGYQLRRAALVTMSGLLDSYASIGMNLTEAALIRFVQSNPGCTQAAIGRALGVKRTNLVPVVNGLMSDGLLRRVPADGRSHSLNLTAKGVEQHRRITKLNFEHEQHYFGDLPAKTRRLLMQTFRLLRDKAERRREREAELPLSDAEPHHRRASGRPRS